MGKCCSKNKQSEKKPVEVVQQTKKEAPSLKLDLNEKRKQRIISAGDKEKPDSKSEKEKPGNKSEKEKSRSEQYKQGNEVQKKVPTRKNVQKSKVQ